MMAANNIITFVYRGGNRDDVPDDITRVIIHETVTIIPSQAFCFHQNIIEVYCHAGVKEVRRGAFHRCPSLVKVIIPGVEIVEGNAFNLCEAIEYVECNKLQIVGKRAFANCGSLSSIDLSSVRIVDEYALCCCFSLADVSFGPELEELREGAFMVCSALEQIAIPLKDGLIATDDVFQACTSLRRVDIAEDDTLHDTLNALLLKGWGNDVRMDLNTLNFILPHQGEKTMFIREWISRIARKVSDYKAVHRCILQEIVPILQPSFPKDVVVNNIMSFLELPTHNI